MYVKTLTVASPLNNYLRILTKIINEILQNSCQIIRFLSKRIKDSATHYYIEGFHPAQYPQFPIRKRFIEKLKKTYVLFLNLYAQYVILLLLYFKS